MAASSDTPSKHKPNAPDRRWTRARTENRALEELRRIVRAHPVDRVGDKIGRPAVTRQRIGAFFRGHRRDRQHALRIFHRLRFKLHGHGHTGYHSYSSHENPHQETACRRDSSVLRARSRRSAGMDLRAVERVVLLPGVAQGVPTGIAIELPPGAEAQVRPRSGMALKHSEPLTSGPSIRHTRRNPGDHVQSGTRRLYHRKRRSNRAIDCF